MNVVMNVRLIQARIAKQMASHSYDDLNPIPTGNGLNQPIYSYQVTQAGRNRYKNWKRCQPKNIKGGILLLVHFSGSLSYVVIFPFVKFEF